MILRLALGMVCLGLISGSARAVTAGKPAPAVPVADTAADDNATETNAVPQDEGSPYSSIVRANVFHLTEPPKPPAAVDPVIQNLPTVKISGFKHREGEPVRALFTGIPKDPKDPWKYFNLAEGEKDDILEVKKIYPDEQSVDVVIAGTPVTLNISSNSFVQPVVIPKAGTMGASVAASMPNPTANPGLLVHPNPNPNPNPAAYNGPAPTPINNGGGGVIIAGGGGSTAAPAASTVTTIGGGAPQGLPGAPGGQPQYGNYNGGAVGVAPANTGDTALRQIPTRGVRTQNYPPVYQPQTLLEAQAHAAVYHEMNQAAIQSGEMPPAPPLPQ